MSDIIVGLDVGTSNVRVVAAAYTEEGNLQIIGVGTSPSTGGLRKGVVIQTELTKQAIVDAVEKAELMSGHEISDCYIAIGGTQIESTNQQGFVSVENQGGEITDSDIKRVIESACSIPIPPDRRILHVLPYTYMVDGVDGIKDPRSMIAWRLETEVLIVTAAYTTTNTLVTSINQAGYTVDGLMLKILATSRSVITKDERELGSILIDLGGGTTDVIVFADDAPVYTCSIPVGGQMVTNDIMIVKGITFDISEKIKIKAGCCWEEYIDEDEEVLIPGVGGRPPEAISRKELCGIIQPRMEEIFNLVNDKIQMQASTKKIVAKNIILCGGGSLMPGVVELAAQVFGTSAVRIGNPLKMGGMIEECYSPEYATATGIVLSFAEEAKKQPEKKHYSTMETKQNNGGILKKLGDYIKEFF